MSHIHDYSYLIRRVRIALSVVVIGLIGSGLTTFPLLWEAELLNSWFGKATIFYDYLPAVSGFISHIHEGVIHTDQYYPFIFYGLDWLGFAHIAIALCFIGPLRDPVRNQWVIEWGILICLLAVPAIFYFGISHNMPFFWNFIDGIFPLLALIPLTIAWYLTKELTINDGCKVKGKE